MGEQNITSTAQYFSFQDCLALEKEKTIEDRTIVYTETAQSLQHSEVRPDTY